jgi:LysR family glycine cleavage system transcriptional activator
VHHRILPPNGWSIGSADLLKLILASTCGSQQRRIRSISSGEEVAVAARRGDGNWSGLDAIRFCPEQLFPVCSPKLMVEGHRITKPSDLRKTPLLHLNDSKAWSRWCDATGVADAGTGHGLALNRASMLIDVAVDGQGVARVRRSRAWDRINGRVIRAFDVV